MSDCESWVESAKRLDAHDYMRGFGNVFATEALAGALPARQNSPQRCPYDLYAEQLSGSAFTAPRANNKRSWLYRLRPSVRHSGRFERTLHPSWKTAPHVDPEIVSYGQFRWDAPPDPEHPLTFIEGVRTMTTAGDAASQTGLAAHIFLANRDMVDDYFMNADGELLILPQCGRLRLATEFGVLEVAPGELAVIPRGVVFRVEIASQQKLVRGYICENYGAPFSLPELGPIGANGLANPRDFLTPVAAYEDRTALSLLTVKWCGAFHETQIPYSPLDVVAWHGNFAPYKYDLSDFSPVGSVAFDHPDPSIFTVLTSPSGDPGVANVDFVIFPPRGMVAEDTFRPPWFHRNVMSEFMGLIHGRYDAKEEGFAPGGASLHNSMAPHGPDADAFEKATHDDLAPMKLDNTLTFMFESRYPQHLTRWAADARHLQQDYIDCWAGLKKLHQGNNGQD